MNPFIQMDSGKNAVEAVGYEVLINGEKINGAIGGSGSQEFMVLAEAGEEPP